MLKAENTCLLIFEYSSKYTVSGHAAASDRRPMREGELRIILVNRGLISAHTTAKLCT